MKKSLWISFLAIVLLGLMVQWGTTLTLTDVPNEAALWVVKDTINTNNTLLEGESTSVRAAYIAADIVATNAANTMDAARAVTMTNLNTTVSNAFVSADSAALIANTNRVAATSNAFVNADAAALVVMTNLNTAVSNAFAAADIVATNAVYIIATNSANTLDASRAVTMTNLNTAVSNAFGTADIAVTNVVIQYFVAPGVTYTNIFTNDTTRAYTNVYSANGLLITHTP